MENVLTVARRELGAYFVSPIAYVTTAAFLVINGVIFALGSVQFRDASLRTVLSSMAIILMLVTPAIAMRLISEEARQGTVELLLTSPLRDAEMVIGKFLAALALMALMIGCTLYYVLMLVIFGKPDLGQIAAGYLGVLLLGASFLALGLLASALTQNQIIAAITAFGGSLVFWFLSGLATLTPQPARAVLQYAGFGDHFLDFARGVVDSRHVVFYLTIIVVFVFLTIRTVESRRWR